MYQNVCKKCGSLDLHTEVKGSNVGLYCDDCGAWIKWLGKDEQRAFEHSKKMHGFSKEEAKIYEKAIDEMYKPIRANEPDNVVIDELNKFIVFLDKEIDKELCRIPLSPEDAVVKCSVAMTYEKDKNALINIINGRPWNEIKM
jgi:transcription initiation factor TFIIIB Brf1 subunit/transcription initiation factor TFIIB